MSSNQVSSNGRAAISFPVTTEATAREYQFDPAPLPPVADSGAQRALFANPNPSRLVSFDTFASPAERESIRARAAEAARPSPLRQGKMELNHAKPRKKVSAEQQILDFFGSEEVVSPPQSHIICDAPVAPNSLRIQASIIDGLIMLAGMVLIFSGFVYMGGPSVIDKHTLPFLIMALVTVPLFYKGMWTFVGRDSYGTTAAGLRIVDFDGNPPSQSRRYQRLAGSFVSVLAAGVGLIWALVDEDSLTWHDHISGTFPTFGPDFSDH